MPLISKLFQICRDICNLDICTLIVLIIVCIHLEQIDQSDEIIFLSDWNLYRNCILAKTVNDCLYRHEKVCTHLIHLIDECHTWNIVCVSLTPYVL